MTNMPTQDAGYGTCLCGDTAPPRGPGASRGAWTLIEMIVVIAVVGVLVALTLPALAGSLRSARRVACAANLRSFGQAFAVYRGASKDIMPFADSRADLRVGRAAPFDKLQPYIDAPFPTLVESRVQVGAPYRCPMDRADAFDTGFSYYYQPSLAMAAWAAEVDAAYAQIQFARRQSDDPKTMILHDFRPWHDQRINALMADGSVSQ
ncbi:MAG: hypothetical protein ACKVS8_14035 [Phycisphaerales bacterium]